jgi:hypothetical protein
MCTCEQRCFDVRPSVRPSRPLAGLPFQFPARRQTQQQQQQQPIPGSSCFCVRITCKTRFSPAGYNTHTTVCETQVHHTDTHTPTPSIFITKKLPLRFNYLFFFFFFFSRSRSIYLLLIFPRVVSTHRDR